MKRFNKGAQFFLLAAVVISAVMLSLGMTSNKASVNKELDDLYGFVYDVKSESSGVIDYQIFHNFNDDTNLKNFTNLMGVDVRDKYNDADFVVIYGNFSYIVVENHGENKIRLCCDLTSLVSSCPEIEERGRVGGGVGSSSGGAQVSGELEDVKNKTCMGISEDIRVELGDNIYRVDISENKKVVFLIKKEVGDESFVGEG